MRIATWIMLLISLGVFVAAARSQEPPLPNPDVMSQEYWTLWNDDVQKAIDERIEKHRKADAKIELRNVKPDSDVKVEQISSEFLFGANIFNFDQLGSKELDDKYKAIFGDLLNSASIAFYWTQLEMDKGVTRYEPCDEDNPEFWANTKDPTSERFWRRPAPDPVVEFCEQKGIFRHGHPIIWGSRGHGVPKWLDKNMPEDVIDMKRRMRQRIIDLAERYGDRIDRWDVVNESAVDFLNPHHPKYDVKNPFGSYGLMPRDYTFKTFQLVDKVFPKNVVLSINDYQNGQLYVDQVNDLLKRGCRIDMMGLQMHLFNPKQCADIAKGAKIQTPEQVLGMLKTVSQPNLPLHLSEITITAPDDTPEGREIQANITRNLYRLWFSWPNMVAITWWNLVDGCGLKGEPMTSGVTTRQLEPKPAYHAMDRLINYEWRTNFTKKAESETVEISFRGFKGKYKISWTDKDGQPRSKEIVVR